jgi:hypothetical protein
MLPMEYAIRIKTPRNATGWLQLAIYTGRAAVAYAQAKVYDEPSRFGINAGRVSKLSIATPGDQPWGAREFYAYDRGLDFDHCDAHNLPGLAEAVVAYLEAAEFS